MTTPDLKWSKSPTRILPSYGRALVRSCWPHDSMVNGPGDGLIWRVFVDCAQRLQNNTVLFWGCGAMLCSSACNGMLTSSCGSHWLIAKIAALSPITQSACWSRCHSISMLVYNTAVKMSRAMEKEMLKSEMCTHAGLGFCT